MLQNFDSWLLLTVFTQLTERQITWEIRHSYTHTTRSFTKHIAQKGWFHRQLVSMLQYPAVLLTFVFYYSCTSEKGILRCIKYSWWTLFRGGWFVHYCVLIREKYTSASTFLSFTTKVAWIQCVHKVWLFSNITISFWIHSFKQLVVVLIGVFPLFLVFLLA